ncbi:MAG: argininosuccinate synthase [Alphaproteobacteria bacterium]
MLRRNLTMAKVVLAYSGGLDTSVAIHWFTHTKGHEVLAFMADLGQPSDMKAIADRARKSGAIGVYIEDLKEAFITDYVFPAVKANAVYENGYLLHTALGRPLIVKKMVEIAEESQCEYVAHGCTGKGNDQVRFEVGVTALAPHLKVIAPVREWQFKTREEEMDYAAEHGIEIPVTRKSPYSIDRNLWGVSIECGELEDPWNAPPAGAYLMTRSPEDAPGEPVELEIGFEQGAPISLDGKPAGPVELITALNVVGGDNAVGRIDILENRVVGIKSREIYEGPAATILHTAHRALEDLTLSANVAHFKAAVAREYSHLIYNGLWFSDLRESLDAFINTTQRHVTGTVRLRLYKGNCTVTGRKSPYSLYNESLATYGEGDAFRHESAKGFLEIYGLPSKAEGLRRKANK